MTGGELYSLIQITASFEEKFSRVVESDDFDGGALYKLRGWDIETLHNMCKEMEMFLRDVQIGGKV